MPSRKIELIKNHYYHIYNRGFDKQIIFKNNDDFQRFFKTIIRYNKIFSSVKILAYAFLPNHFHIILKSEGDGKDISDFMRKISQSYAIYFRSKYSTLSPDSKLTKGPVFEGRFKAKMLQTEEYLYQCLVYVSMNPVKHNIVDNIKDYKWTSYDKVNKNKINKYGDIELNELEF